MKFRSKTIPKFVGSKMVDVVFILIWLGSPTIAQWTSSTSSPCLTKLSQGVCGETSVDYTQCCAAVLEETQTDTECMCRALTDSDAASLFATSCQSTIYYGSVITLCQASLISTPTSTIFAPPSASTTPTRPPPSGNNNKTIIVIVVTLVVIVAVIISSIGIIWICCCKPKIRPNVSNSPHSAYLDVSNDQGLPSQYVSTNLTQSAPSSTMPKVSHLFPSANKGDFVTAESLQYQLATIQVATNNFSTDNIIGRGGFGYVYKGTFPDGKEIAVKRLSHDSRQGDKEFKAEIELLANLRHRNLVRLLGFCLTVDEALLVYELMSNRSLDYFLFDNAKGKELNWSVRYEIIKGIARGMLYLHEDSPQRIIHRDLKPANVLLDAKMNPKIADFGLARICDLDQTHVNTTRVIGTLGYMSPEYEYQKQFSVKSDVYALGVIILEILSGRRIKNRGSNNQSGELTEGLMSYAWRCWREGKPLTLSDPLMKKDSVSSNDEIAKCVHLGLLCVQDDPRKRPDMSSIVHTLNSDSGAAALNITPQHPVFMYPTSSIQSTTSTTTLSNVASTGGVSSPSYSQFKSSR